MTSTNFNIGFIESKNSSRVLRPPGGGHTDIFGIRDGSDSHTPSKRKIHPPSTINSCFMHEENPKPKNEDEKNGNQIEVKTDENSEPKEVNDNEENEKTEKETVVAPRRTRVPPGGYSSGLW